MKFTAYLEVNFQYITIKNIIFLKKYLQAFKIKFINDIIIIIIKYEVLNVCSFKIKPNDRAAY